MAKVSGIFSKILIIVFLVLVTAGIILSFVGITPEIQDASSEYKFTDYKVEMTYNKDGTIDAKEVVTVDYLVKSNGVCRALPETSKIVLNDKEGNTIFNDNIRLTYSKINVEEDKFAYESSNNIMYIRIGKEKPYYEQYLGPKEYTISYKITLDERLAMLDYFYYNVVGHITDTTVDNCQITLKFAEEISNPNLQVIVGKAGTVESESKPYTANWIDNKTLKINITSTLGVAEGVTVKCDLPENYAKVAENHTTNIVMLVANILTAVIVFLCFWKCSNKKTIVPVVQFSVDKKYTPADVGYIIDKKVDSEDVASLIIYWAEKGYLKIIQEKKKTYLQKTNKTFEGKTYEKELFGSIFAGKSVEDKVDIKKIGLSIAEEVATSKKMIAIENENIFSKKAVGVRTFFIALVGIIQAITLATVNYKNVNDAFVFLSVLMGIATIVGLLMFSYKADKKLTLSKKSKIWTFLALGVFLAVSLFVAIKSFDAYADKCFTVFVSFALVVFACVIIWKYNTRSDQGCEELGDIIGLKNFIEVAEKDRLKMLVEDDPESFYKIMPYAYVLGVYDTWCKKFESIDVGKPSFYYSDTDFVFSTLWIASIMNTTTNSILSSINTANIKNAMDTVASHTGGFGGSGGIGGGGAGGGGFGRW